MATTLACVTLDCADPRRLAAFWASTLGYVAQEEKDDWVVVQPVRGGDRSWGSSACRSPRAARIVSTLMCG